MIRYEPVCGSKQHVGKHGNVYYLNFKVNVVRPLQCKYTVGT